MTLMLHVAETGVPVVSLEPESSGARGSDGHSSACSLTRADGLPAGTPCGSLTPLLNTHAFGVLHAAPQKTSIPLQDCCCSSK